MSESLQFIPIVERCTADILDTLATVTTANGYGCTITQVAFDTAYGLHPDYGTSPAVNGGVLLEEGDVFPSDDAPVNKSDWWQPYTLLCYAIEEPDSLYRARRQLHIMRGAIANALTKSETGIDGTYPAYQRGGNAADTQITGWGFFRDGDFPVLLLQFKCYVREQLTDPNAQ